jgi:hypothetical protein
MCRRGMRMERDARLEARIGEAPGAKDLAGDGEGGPAAEGVPGDAGRVEVEPVLERPRLMVERGELVERKFDVQRPGDGGPHIPRRLRERDAGVLFPFPDLVVAPLVLDVGDHIAVARPVPAEVFVGLARAAEAVREDDDRKRTGALLRRIDLHRHRPVVAHGVDPVVARDRHGERSGVLFVGMGRDGGR